MRVLIVDDDASLRHSLSLLLADAGHEVTAEGDPEAALRRALGESPAVDVGGERFDLILCDVRMPRLDGLSFLRRYREQSGDAILIMMSAYGTEDAALEAIREGAYDWLRKPFRPDEVVLTLRKAEERERLRHEVDRLRAAVGADAARDLMVAESRSMRQLLELAARVAHHATTVLVTGESGTGKEVLARAIHRLSPRRDADFTAVNCAAIPEALLESELFGHVRGAFTGAAADRAGLFETAHQGTLLLDEIGDLPVGLQAKLLRVLEEGEVRRLGTAAGRSVDVRVIAATSRELERDVETGRFRADLFYRLNVVQLHIPPLRERRDDIAALLAHYARQAAQRLGHPVSITPRALAALCEHSWPGNVRELRNAVERAAVLNPSGRLDLSDFLMSTGPAGHGGNGANGTNGHANGAPALGPEAFSLKPQVERIERVAIHRALEASRGSRREAAQLLGVSLRTLFYKLRRYGLE